MEYLSKVIDETLRVVNVSLFTYREAKADVSIGGYTISKGWKVLVWFRGIHLDPECYKNPKEFNPSRWNEGQPKKELSFPLEQEVGCALEVILQNLNFQRFFIIFFFTMSLND
ncbi:Cytochrome P450, B-class [Parasponia andersonii]|uniref:Cytochrome P450, B-class n=1 Tax=Parasponia andersonii TaxID=3476 RepID=A0A2P5C7R5_PARAD|nr:Cytochrome P450, B-class [Parasponia andersonii]